MSSSDEESFRSESIDSDELNEEIDIPEEDDSDESNHEFDMTKQIESIKKKKRRDDANERISRQQEQRISFKSSNSQLSSQNSLKLNRKLSGINIDESKQSFNRIQVTKESCHVVRASLKTINDDEEMQTRNDLMHEIKKNIKVEQHAFNCISK